MRLRVYNIYMDQKKINYLIVGVVALLLIILGVYYYKTKGITTPIPPQQGGEEPLSPPSEGGVLAPSEGGGNAIVPALSAAEITTKFNISMKNARTAFLNKDYPQSIADYKQALTYKNTDTPYAGLFVDYGAQGDWVNAIKALDSAIKINPLFTDYWVSKLTVMDEKTAATYQDLKNVYNEGLLKVDPKTKVNLVTALASIAENRGQISDAIALWSYAKSLYPQNSSIYQAEIDSLPKI